MFTAINNLFAAAYVRKIHPFFDPNFYLLLINFLITGFFAYYQHWTGKEALQLLFVNISISLPFALLIYIFNPRPEKNDSRLVRLSTILFFLVVGTPLVTLGFVLLSFLLPLDVPAAFQGKSIAPTISMFYTILFTYILYLYSQFTIPTVSFVIQYTFLALHDYIKERNTLFSHTHPLGTKVFQFKIFLPVFVLGFNILASTALNRDINRDSFAMWFILCALFLLNLLVYLNDFYRRNRYY